MVIRCCRGMGWALFAGALLAGCSTRTAQLRELMKANHGSRFSTRIQPIPLEGDQGYCLTSKIPGQHSYVQVVRWSQGQPESIFEVTSDTPRADCRVREGYPTITIERATTAGPIGQVATVVYRWDGLRFVEKP